MGERKTQPICQSFQWNFYKNIDVVHSQWYWLSFICPSTSHRTVLQIQSLTIQPHCLFTAMCADGKSKYCVIGNLCSQAFIYASEGDAISRSHSVSFIFNKNYVNVRFMYICTYQYRESFLKYSQNLVSVLYLTDINEHYVGLTGKLSIKRKHEIRSLVSQNKHTEEEIKYRK